MNVRELSLPDDAAALLRIDTAYVADAEYEVVRNGGTVGIAPRNLTTSRRHRFDGLATDLRGSERAWHAGVVATSDTGEIAGFAAYGFDAWNRRLRIWHLYVDAPYRRTGVARALLDTVLRRARELDASHVFVETPNVNVPAVRAYTRLGFEIVGFDAVLYRSTAAAGEFAVYLARDCA